MALIISPKTTEKQILQFAQYFNLKKIPNNEANLELGNLNDNFYFTRVSKIPVYIILTGYSGASVGFAVAQYEKNYKDKDPYPEAYFIGSIIKTTRAKNLKLADILYAGDSYGEDEWTQSIYRIAKKRKLSQITKPDKSLVKRINDIARKEKFNLKSGRILCRWHPGYTKDSKFIVDLLDEGFWWKFVLSGGEYKNHKFDGGEIESASFLATCRLAKIPAIALLDVRDERVGKGYGKFSYRIANKKDKAKAQENLLKLIKLSLCSLDFKVKCK